MRVARFRLAVVMGSTAATSIVLGLGSPALARPDGVLERDEGLLLDITFADESGGVPVPIPIEDRIYYCDIAREFSERVWEATVGQHYVSAVHFWDGYTLAEKPVSIRWYHRDGDALVHNSTLMDMYDAAVGCRSTFLGVDESDQLIREMVCDTGQTCMVPPDGSIIVAGDPVPAGSTTAGLGLTNAELHRTVCVDGNGNTIREGTTRVGWTLAHELGHLAYNLSDEYDKNNLLGVCVGEPDNNGTDETSMMAALDRNHFCDEETHLGVRQIKDVDGNLLFHARG